MSRNPKHPSKDIETRAGGGGYNGSGSKGSGRSEKYGRQHASEHQLNGF